MLRAAAFAAVADAAVLQIQRLNVAALAGVGALTLAGVPARDPEGGKPEHQPDENDPNPRDAPSSIPGQACRPRPWPEHPARAVWQTCTPKSTDEYRSS
jgi:hypothetical protein